MEFKGTKEEWVIRNLVIDSIDGDAICNVWDFDTGESKALANIKLMNASKDLLNALQIYLNAGSKTQRREASVIAKKAINKALS